MITKNTDLNSAYQSLFENINAASDNSLEINDIYDYFGNVKEISLLNPKFLRLPLDEPLFAIDANSRKIEIPADFRSNGVSVQNDHLAETVYFSIDRYFDHTDLGTDTFIVINWKMGAESGRTKHFGLDKDAMPGYLIFGWPIDQIVTKKSGSLQFAIEIYKKDQNDKISYRFNTLPANVTIKDGLVIDEDAEIVSLDEAILSSLVDSAFGEGEATVGDIRWLTDGLVLGSDGRTMSVNPYQSELKLRVYLNEGEPLSQSINLIAQAYVDNDTYIQYSTEEGNITPVVLGVNVDQVLVEDHSTIDLSSGKVYFKGTGDAAEPISSLDEITDDTQVYMIKDLDPNLIYLVKIDGEDAYEAATEEDIEKWGTAEQVDLYVQVAQLNVATAGQYFVKAQGQKWKTYTNEETGEEKRVKIGSSDQSATKVVTVAEPTEIAAINVIPQPLDSELDENYSFATDQNNVAFLVGEESTSFTASADVDFDPQFNALQFVWQKKNGNNQFENISNDAVPFQLINENVLTVSEPGEYKVSVVNFQNGVRTEPVYSNVVTASILAQKISSAKVSYLLGNSTIPSYLPANNSLVYNTSVMTRNKITLIINPDDIEMGGEVGVGNLEYEWYDAIIDEETNTVIGKELIANAGNSNIYVVNNGDRKIIPVVKNNYNGSIYTLQLGLIDIDDRA